MKEWVCFLFLLLLSGGKGCLFVFLSFLLHLSRSSFLFFSSSVFFSGDSENRFEGIDR